MTHEAAHAGDDHHADHLQDRHPRGGERLLQRGCSDLVGLGEPGEFRGVVQAEPDVEPDSAERAGEQKRYPPAVTFHGPVGQHRL